MEQVSPTALRRARVTPRILSLQCLVFEPQRQEVTFAGRAHHTRRPRSGFLAPHGCLRRLATTGLLRAEARTPLSPGLDVHRHRHRASMVHGPGAPPVRGRDGRIPDVVLNDFSRAEARDRNRGSRPGSARRRSRAVSAGSRKSPSGARSPKHPRRVRGSRGACPCTHASYLKVRADRVARAPKHGPRRRSRAPRALRAG